MHAVGDILERKYEIVGLLGEGGMGAVYEARHVRIGKRLAIKVLRPELAQHREAAERFTREAQAAASIGHPGIIDIHDLGIDDAGAPYLVMEFLEGESLADLIEREGQLDLNLVAYIGCQVLSALDAAHAVGIVHRDLKPDNLFLVDRRQQLPEVKLLDFGISMFVDAQGGSADYRLTQTGQLLGTPYYMSPEQTLGRTDLDQRTDLYSLGVILYEATTANVPFTGSNIFALAHSIQTDEPVPPSKLRPDLSPALAAIIDKALRKDPDSRYSTAAEMLGELRTLVEEPSQVLLTVGGLQSSAPSSPQRSGGSFPRLDRLSKKEIESAPTPLPPPVGDKRPSQAPTVAGVPTGAVTVESTDSPEPSTDRSTAADLAATELSLSNVRSARQRSRGAWLSIAIICVTLGLAGGLVALLTSENDVNRDEVTSTAGEEHHDAGRDGATHDVATVDGGADPVSSEDDAATTGDASPDPVMVTITLQGVPEGANILLDGAPIRGHELRREVSRQEHELRIELEGYEPWTRAVAFTENQVVEVTLHRRARRRTDRIQARATRAVEPSPPPPTKRPPLPPTKRDTPRSRFGSEFE